MRTIKIQADENGNPIARVPEPGEKYIRIWGSETPDTQTDDDVSMSVAAPESLTIRDKVPCLIVVEDEG